MPIVFDRKKRTKRVFSTNNLSGKTKKYQESSQEIQETPRNPEKFKNRQEITRGLKIPGYNLAHRKKKPNHKSSGRKSKINGNKIYKHPKVDQIVVGCGSKLAAISNHIPYIDFGSSQLVKPLRFHVTGPTHDENVASKESHGKRLKKLRKILKLGTKTSK